MDKQIYLDNNATTKIDEEVYNAMLPYLTNNYGNPSSIYSFGKEVKEQIEETRKIVAKLLNADKNEIVFTSCASESNVTAIMNAIRNNPNKKHIITTKVEHASIIETMNYLETQGYNITYLNVDSEGKLNLKELEDLINDNTLLVSVMMANNEIGNIYPIKEITNIAKKHNILVHCDAVQAVGKINIDVKDLNIDTLSISGHKIHAPKGVGVLYIKNNIPYTPLIFGHQEKKRRGGTENVANIIGLGKAVEILLNNNHNNKIKELRDYMEQEITKNISDTKIYGDINNRLSNTSSIAFKDVSADKLLLLLESFNIYVSTGSACNSEIALPSHVLTACNANLKEYSPIRISLSKYTTKEEIDIFIKILTNIIDKIRRN